MLNITPISDIIKQKYCNIYIKCPKRLVYNVFNKSGLINSLLANILKSCFCDFEYCTSYTRYEKCNIDTGYLSGLGNKAVQKIRSCDSIENIIQNVKMRYYLNKNNTIKLDTDNTLIIFDDALKDSISYDLFIDTFNHMYHNSNIFLDSCDQLKDDYIITPEGKHLYFDYYIEYTGVNININALKFCDIYYGVFLIKNMNKEFYTTILKINLALLDLLGITNYIPTVDQLIDALTK